MKVLIFVGFDDIRCDMEIFGVEVWKVGILLGLVGFFSWCVDKLTTT